jgi:hypothetical protein
MSYRTEGVKLQKGDVVMMRGTNWPAVVWENTRHKPLVKEFGTVLVNVYGYCTEAGSVYCTDLAAVNTPRGREVQVFDVRVPEAVAALRHMGQTYDFNAEEVILDAQKMLAKRPKPKVRV